MPRIGELLGVIFYIYFSDHKPDHIHAIYQNNEALFTLEGKLIKGKLPAAKLKIAVKFIHDNKELIIKMKEKMSNT
jgi:hypothetical protein